MDPINPIAGNPEALNQNPQTSPMPVPPPAPIAPTPAPTPISPEMLKPKRKVSPVILIAVLLLILGIGGFLAFQKGLIKLGGKTATPTPAASPTITWQTYTNTELGYQINYPIGATLDVTGAPNKVEINPTVDQRIVINLGDEVNKVTPESVVKYAPSPITIAGLPTYIEELGNETDGKYQNYYFAKNNLAFWIFVVPSKDETNKTLINQTLATFKFLGQTQTTAPTTDWKTYTNSDYGISFQYPADYAVTLLNGAINLQKNTTRALLYLSKSDNPDQLDISQWFDSQPTDNTLPIKNTSTLTETTVDGHKALNFTKIQPEVGYKDLLVIVGNKTNVYFLNFGTPENEVELSNQILSTLKFTP